MCICYALVRPWDICALCTLMVAILSVNVLSEHLEHLSELLG